MRRHGLVRLAKGGEGELMIVPCGRSEPMVRSEVRIVEDQEGDEEQDKCEGEDEQHT